MQRAVKASVRKGREESRATQGMAISGHPFIWSLWSLSSQNHRLMVPFLEKFKI